ncbi:MAG: D-alanine--D-alanine ligase [Thermoleophilia bacterium]|nr:D-alanine--D-alanine ligase [Thermoleophilia bacterium]
MAERLRVAVLGGGRSSEHDVSLRSAASVAAGLDSARFDVVSITISRTGLWTDAAGEPVAVTPGAGGPLACDVVFPALHGPFGEDGTVQGLLEMLGVPYVGSGVLGSALTMDKERCKSVLREAGIDVAREVVVHRYQARAEMHEQIAALGYPVFVKPARLGSSVGISRVETAAAIDAALDLAIAHDDKVLVEELLVGDEVECSVLGLAPNLNVSKVGRIGFHNEWYDYDAKYSDGGSWLEVPAHLPAETASRLRDTAARAFTLCDCHGMARIDFFHTREGRLVLNEINTIPGFTATSYYARMFEASGIAYGDLLARLIELALERFASESSLLR